MGTDDARIARRRRRALLRDRTGASPGRAPQARVPQGRLSKYQWLSKGRSEDRGVTASPFLVPDWYVSKLLTDGVAGPGGPTAGGERPFTAPVAVGPKPH